MEKRMNHPALLAAVRRGLAVLTLAVLPAAADAADRALPLRALVQRAATETLAEFGAPALRPEQLAVTVIDLRDPAQPVAADFRGEAPYYPASVIKLFFLAYTHRQLEDGRLADTAELRRGLRDMIVESANDATGYVVDVISGTTSGPELAEPELAEWSRRRGAVAREGKPGRLAENPGLRRNGTTNRGPAPPPPAVIRSADTVRPP